MREKRSVLYSQVGIRINVTEFHLPNSSKILKTDRKCSRDNAELRRLLRYRCGGSSFQSNYKTVPLGWRRVALGIYNPSPSISIKGADRMYNFFNGYKFLNIPAIKRTSSVWEADCFDQQNTTNLYHAIFEAMGSNPCNSHLVPLRCLLQGCFLLELRCLFE